MRFTMINMGALASVVLAAVGCSPMSNLTIGKHNMIGIELAIDCKIDEALVSIEKEMSADEEGYRRISYVLTAAIYDELGKKELWDANETRFKNDPKVNNKKPDSFLQDMNDFKKYLNKKRLDKYGDSSCDNVKKGQ